MADQEKKSRKKGVMGIASVILLVLAGLGIYQGSGGGLLPGSSNSNSLTEQKQVDQQDQIVEVKVKEAEIYWLEAGQEQKMSQDQFKEKLQALKADSQVRLIDDKAIKSTFDFVKKEIQGAGIEIIETIEQ